MTSKSIFENLDKSVIDSILSDKRNECVVFQKGEIIFDENNFSKKLGILRVGKAKVRNRGVGGVTIRVLVEGSCFGVASLFNDSDRYVSVIEALEVCEVLFIPQEVLSEKMIEHPLLAQNFIRFLTNRIIYLNTLIDAYSSPTVESKLARYLIAYSQGHDAPFDINMSELSRILGVGRASLYRATESFEQRGLIEKKGKTFVILDPKKLSEI